MPRAEVGSARRGDEGPERPGGSKQKQAKERNRAGAGGLRCVQALEGRGRPIFPADFIVPGSVLERPPPPLPCRARGCGRAPTRPRGRSLRSARTAASPARSPRSRVRVPPDPLSEARQGFPASSATLYKVAGPFLSFFFFFYFLFSLKSNLSFLLGGSRCCV